MIKNLLKKIIPSYRATESLKCELGIINKELMEIKQSITDKAYKDEYMFWLSQKRENETIQETKRRFFLSMPKADGVLRELQLAELHLLVRLKEICENNHFMLCLASGSLLGAVRHHGFIPWDDDIDTYMMREDALKLFDILRDDKEVSIHYYYRKSGDHIIKLKYKFDDNIFIDIFTFDRIDCTSENKVDVWNQTQIAAHEYEARMMQHITNPNLDFKPNGVPTWIPELDSVVLTEYEEVISKIPFYGQGSSFCPSIYDGYAFRNCFGTGIFDGTELFPLLKKEIEFEGYQFDAFRTYPVLLEREYGNIWNFPDKILSHHMYEVEEGLISSLAHINGLKNG